MTLKQAWAKRVFDIIVSLLGLVVLSWVILLAFFLSSFDTKKSGFFIQTRVGKNGRLFKVIKIRTMKDIPGINTTVTVENDPRITLLGAFFRRAKIDELPQLINVLLGNMSLVGPRPDVPEYYEHISEDERRVLLSVRPGITGPATIKYRAEEEMLATIEDPETFNKNVIFPDKVKMNIEYVNNYSFLNDIRYILYTLFNIKPGM